MAATIGDGQRSGVAEIILYVDDDQQIPHRYLHFATRFSRP